LKEWSWNCMEYCYIHITHASCSFYYGLILHAIVEYSLIGYNILRKATVTRLESGLWIQISAGLELCPVWWQPSLWFTMYSPAYSQVHLVNICHVSQLTVTLAGIQIQSSDSSIPNTGLLKMLYPINEYSNITYKISPR
jgi:hypothetical protein